MLISILAYFGIAYLPTRYFKVKFTYSLPTSLSLIMVFLYICAMYELLFLATYLVYIVGMVSFCSSWDDFSFWGGASKELLLSNVFEKIGHVHVYNSSTCSLPTWTGSISLLYAAIFGIF